VANDQAGLVGRATELAVLDRLLDRVADGQPATALVDGDAGIGKTRLLDELAERVTSRSGLVVRGSAPPTSGDPMPLAAISRMLRDILRQLGPDDGEAIVARSLGLGHLQPAWRLNPTQAPPATSSVALAEELLDVVDSLARDRPLVALLVDDVQWADPATLDVLAYIARSARESRVLIVVTARLDEAAADAPIRRIRAELLRAGAIAMALGPLEPDAAAMFVSGLVGPDVPARRLGEITGLGRGNPLFLRELVDADEGHPAGDRHALPESLVALTRARLGRLSEARLAILQVVATVGDGCTEDLVIRSLGQPESATIADIRPLAEARLLTRVDGGSLAIGHPVLREVVLADALDSQLRRIQATVARLAAADPKLLPGTDIERLIRLANLWHGAGDMIRALPALVRAAEAAEGSFAFATAFDLYTKALRIVDSAAPVAERRIGFQPRPADDSMADLRRRAADSAILAGDPVTAIEWLDQALHGLPDGDVRDRLAFTRARALLALGDAPAALEIYRSELGDRRGHEIGGSARVGYARALIAAGQAEEAVSVAASALVAARAGRSRSDEETALLVLGTALTRSGNRDAGMDRLHEARSLRQRVAGESAIRPRVSRVMDLTGGMVDAASAAESAGSLTHAGDLTRDAAAAARRWGAEGEIARLRIAEATGAIDSGRWSEALAILDETAEHAGSMVASLARRARIAALRGAWERATADLDRCESGLIRARSEDRAAYAIALTELRSWRRQNAAATAAATEGLVLARGAAFIDQLELVTLAVRSHVDVALAARAVRSEPQAREQEEIALALTEPVHPDDLLGQPRAFALATTMQAELARLGPAPAEPWTAARDAWQTDGSAWWRAYASFREGEALLGAPGRRDPARTALTEARSLAGALEAAPLLAEIDALAARGRVELGAAPVEAPRPNAARKLPISERELEVLVLIAKGLTNKEIASALFISERTAAHHVGHIFDKLGVSSRVEAAGWAHQAGVLEGSAGAT
jgi:DNA-binding CsgD family transcriptional regulator